MQNFLLTSTLHDVVLLSPDLWFFFPVFLRSCALTVRARVRPFQRQLVQMFRDETSRDNSATFTCASCAESVQLAQRKIENWHDLNLDVLRRPDKEHNNGVLLSILTRAVNQNACHNG
jgi:hypothetical protein